MKTSTNEIELQGRYVPRGAKLHNEHVVLWTLLVCPDSEIDSEFFAEMERCAQIYGVDYYFDWYGDF